MAELNSCPRCGANWLGKTIPAGLWDTKLYKTKEEAEKAASKYYGWTNENQKRFKSCIMKYDTVSDRTVAIICPKCNFETPC